MKNQDIISMLPRLENDMKLEIQNSDMKLHVQNRSKNMKNVNTKGSNSWKKKSKSLGQVPLETGAQHHHHHHHPVFWDLYRKGN